MKFILTKELGRLSKWLRILGFDAEYFILNNSSSLIIQALRDERVILTRNHRLPKATAVTILLLDAQTVKQQVQEVLRKLNLNPDNKRMFSRCIICNVELAGIQKEVVRDRVPEYVFKTQADFLSCPSCDRIYWRGTHWGNVEDALKEIIK